MRFDTMDRSRSPSFRENGPSPHDRLHTEQGTAEGRRGSSQHPRCQVRSSTIASHGDLSTPVRQPFNAGIGPADTQNGLQTWIRGYTYGTCEKGIWGGYGEDKTVEEGVA